MQNWKQLNPFTICKFSGWIILIFAALIFTGCIHIRSEPQNAFSSPTLPVETAVSLPPPVQKQITSTPLLITTVAPEPTSTTGQLTPLPNPTVAATSESLSELPTYRLETELFPLAAQAQVSQTITITNHSNEAWQEIVFHMAQAHWPGVFDLQETAVIQNNSSQIITPTLENTMLQIPLEIPLQPAETLAVSFDYTLNLPTLDPVGWGPTGNTGWSPNVIQMGDWYPSLVPFRDGQWQTWEFKPVGDPVINELANFDVSITIPPGYEIAAPGKVTGNDNENRFQIENARAFAFLTSNKYFKFENSEGETPVTVYTTRADERVGSIVLETAVDAINFLSGLYGPYPYDELIIAENGFLTAMEYSGLVSLSGFAFDTYNGTPESLLIPLTVHEIAHQWWYGAVGNDQVHEPWIDESMAMMAELLYYEDHFPEQIGWWWWFRVDRWNPEGYVDATIYDYADSPTFIHNMYGQATYFMYNAREKMGQDSFKGFLSNFVAENTDKIVTGEDFLTKLKQQNSDTDLQPLIDAYFENE